MSLYSLNPTKFQEAGAQLAERERRQEWPLLHGDGAMTWENDIERANRRIMELEAEVAELKRARP